jgi:hypothetical protein
MMSGWAADKGNWWKRVAAAVGYGCGELSPLTKFDDVPPNSIASASGLPGPVEVAAVPLPYV